MIPGFPNPIDNVEWKSKKKLSRAGAEEIFMSINESGYRDQPPSTSNLHLSSDRESDGWFCSHKIISTLMLQNTMYLSDIWLYMWKFASFISKKIQLLYTMIQIFFSLR